MPLLTPPVAFVAYLAFAALLLGLGRLLGGRQRRSGAGAMAYASGERMSARGSLATGYAPFYGTALFFAIVHVAVLIGSSGGLSPIGLIYVVGILGLLAVVGSGS